MYWIEKLSRDGHGHIEFVGRSIEGPTTCFRPDEFPHNLSATRQTKYRVRVTSDTHRVTSVDDYLTAMGWGFSGEAQRLHRFEGQGTTIWIPSQVMLKLMFSSAVSFYQLLFSPRSLSELAVTGFTESLTLLPGWANSNDGWSDNDVRRNRLFWLLNSASATRSWRQVFRNALDGVLDVPLPKGCFEIFVSGKRHGDVILTTDARLHSVVCDDLSFPDGSPLARREFVFSSTTGKEVRRANRGLHFECIKDITKWELSDDQFARLLEEMFKNGALQNPHQYGAHLKQRLRRHLNLLRARHMIPCEWGALPCSKQELACAQNRLYKLQNNGHWETMRNILLSAP